MAAMQMESREKKALALGAAIVVAAGLYWLAQGPLEKYRQSQAQLNAVQANLADAKAIHEKVIEIRREEETLERLLAARGTQYDLGTSIYRALQAHGLTDRSETETLPRRGVSAVRLELDGVSMQELVDLLYDIHSSDDLVVLEELRHLRPIPSEKGLMCEMVLITPKSS